jgi:hypothetical protein
MAISTRLLVGVTATMLAFSAVEFGRSQPPTSLNEPAVVGVWTQYVESPNKPGEWKEYGSFRVLVKDDTLLMTIEDQSTAPKPGLKSQGLFNVHADGQQWTFSSDWGNDTIAQFKLNRVTDEVYEGHSYLDNTPRNHNLWVRSRK